MYHPALSLVSKRFLSLLASPGLNKTRSLLCRTESCLYVSLNYPSNPNPNPRWFTLCQKPDKALNFNLTNKSKSSGKFLSPVPSSQSLPVLPTTSQVHFGSDVYQFRISRLSRLPREYPAPIVIDGKIYVVGHITDFDFSKWIEVFDPESQAWKFVSADPVAEMNANIYDYKYVAYNPKVGSCEHVDWEIRDILTSYSHCVVNNVLCFYHHYEKKLRWYCTYTGVTIILNGLQGLPKFTLSTRVKLVEYGGKMIVFWDKSASSNKKTIWCAEIALERCDSGEIYGKVEWVDAVLNKPDVYEFVHVLTATV